MRVFITGFMASGKTQLAKQLAPILVLPYLDLDDLIEKNSGESIPEIFKSKGETYFRRIEEQALAEIIQKKEDFVLACGGGTILSEANRNIMKETGVTVFIDTDTGTIYKRLLRERNKRPLLAETKPEELLSKITKLYNTRSHHYHEADIRFSGAFEKEYENLARLIREQHEKLVCIGRISG